MTGDVLASIDAATDEWDTWDGRSADAATWRPTEATGDRYVAVSLDDPLTHVHHTWNGADTHLWVQTMMAQMREGLRIGERIARLIEDGLGAVPVVEQQQPQPPRPRHAVPFWTEQPNKSRRR